MRVRAHSVVQDIHGETSGLGQDFALVISGLVVTPGVGIVSLDRDAYTVPSQIKISLVDTDLAGQPSVSVVARSTTETNGETVLLHASSSSGSFTGAIATATGPAAVDGKLQVANNNTIEVSYFDASLGITRVASARADLLPPVLTNPSVTNAYGQTFISWSSGEPANAIVRFGTNASIASLTLAVTNLELTSSHSLALGGLVAGRTYYYYVVSTDEAGNTATNSNSGALFSFVVPATPSLLLLDEYQDQFFGAPPLSGYTAALNQVGISYDIWDAGSRGAPTLNNLRPYRAIIWRVSELTGAWSAAELSAISNYLAGGGGLFVASMEVLSRLEPNTNFIRKVLQVQSYIPDPDSTGAAEVIGSPVDNLTTGLDMVLDYSVYENLWGGFI